ncbi:MAG: glutamyl-tRNA reductase [Candidatus Omnitrophota bacterium]|jgi:glutamyl-tRNA reductase
MADKISLKSFILIGVNHKTAPVSIREKFSVSESDYASFNAKLTNHTKCLEQVVVSTCNRTEVYLISDIDEISDKVISLLVEHSELTIDEVRDRTYYKTGIDAIRHLMVVVSGLDSMALGETEILGQIKTAYLKSHADGLTKKYFNILFQKALKLGKDVRTETSIGVGNVSIASIGVKLAMKIFSKLDKKKVLLIGSGQVARSVCEALVNAGVKDLIIANRNRERAEGLVEEFSGRAICFEDMDAGAALADIVISSAGAPKPFIHSKRVELWKVNRSQNPIFMIDLGLPRNIDEDVNDMSDIYLYNLDDLQLIASKAMQGRKSSMMACESMVDKACGLFENWIKSDSQYKGGRIETHQLD